MPAPAQNCTSEYLRRERVYNELSNRPLNELWAAAQGEGGEDARNFLIERYIYLVERVAKKLKKSLPRSEEHGELCSSGTLGLMDAINRYDQLKNVDFEAYATQRIKGAILDGLRSIDWVPRMVRHRTARAEAIREAFKIKTGIEPSDEEIASQLMIPLDEFYRTQGGRAESIKQDSTSRKLISLTPRTRRSENRDSGPYANTPTGYAKVTNGSMYLPESEVESNMNRRHFKETILSGLSCRDRLALILYYYEGLTHAQIGRALGVCNSRVSQILSNVLERLKAIQGLESKLLDAVT